MGHDSLLLDSLRLLLRLLPLVFASGGLRAVMTAAGRECAAIGAGGIDWQVGTAALVMAGCAVLLPAPLPCMAAFSTCFRSNGTPLSVVVGHARFLGAERGSVSDASLQQDEEDAKGVLVFGSKRPPSPRVDPSLSVTAGSAVGTIAALAKPVAACFCFLVLLSRTDFPPLPFALVVAQAQQPRGPGRCRASFSSSSSVSPQPAWRESKHAKRAVRAPRRSARSLNRRKCSRLVGFASGFVSGFASGLAPPPPPPPPPPPSPPPTVRRALLRLRFCTERVTPCMPPSLARACELCSGAAALPPPLRLRRRHRCQPKAASRVPPPKYTTHACDDKETADGDRGGGNVERGGGCGGQGYCGG